MHITLIPTRYLHSLESLKSSYEGKIDEIINKHKTVLAEKENILKEEAEVELVVCYIVLFTIFCYAG